MNTNEVIYDEENPQHQRALGLALLAELATEGVVRWPSECILTSDAEARLVQVMAQAGCTREEMGAAMRSESGHLHA